MLTEDNIHLSNTSSLLLCNTEVWLLQIGLVARSGVHLNSSSVVVGSATVGVPLIWNINHILQLQASALLANVCSDGLVLARSGVDDVVLVLVQTALDVDWSGEAGVFGGRDVSWVDLDGDVEVPVAAGCAAENEVCDVEGAWKGLAERGWRGGVAVEVRLVEAAEGEAWVEGVGWWTWWHGGAGGDGREGGGEEGLGEEHFDCLWLWWLVCLGRCVAC